jgi:hypothetical protein
MRRLKPGSFQGGLVQGGGMAVGSSVKMDEHSQITKFVVNNMITESEIDR